MHRGPECEGRDTWDQIMRQGCTQGQSGGRGMGCAGARMGDGDMWGPEWGCGCMGGQSGGWGQLGVWVLGVEMCGGQSGNTWGPDWGWGGT